MSDLRLKSGERVVDRYNSHLHESVVPLLPEALAKINSQGRIFLVEEVDFGRPIGETVCVVTGRDDQIVYAQRPKRFGLTRFVKNRGPEPTSSVVVILKTADGEAGAYVIVTAFLGHRPEPEPWDRNATANSRAFWASHALIWGCEPTIPGTETAECPW
jgi:hypothetical protein